MKMTEQETTALLQSDRLIAKGWVVSVNTGPGGVPRYPRVAGDWLTQGGLRSDTRAFEKHNKPHRVLSLLSMELLASFQAEGFAVFPGAMAENITTVGIDLMALPLGCEVCFFGGTKQIRGARVSVSEQRKPCFQLDPYGDALKTAAKDRCGVLCGLIAEGPIMPGMQVVVLQAE